MGARFNYASPNEQKVVKTRSHSFGGNNGGTNSSPTKSAPYSQAAMRVKSRTGHPGATAANKPAPSSGYERYAGAFANGGRISGAGSGTSDSLMARVSNGEFVVNAASTKSNLDLLTQINGGSGKRSPNAKIPKFATGGQMNTGGSGGDAPIYLTLNNNYDVQSAMNPQEFQAMLANNSELSFLSVEKKLRETGRSLYK